MLSALVTETDHPRLLTTMIFRFVRDGWRIGFSFKLFFVNLNIGLKTIVVIGQNFWNDCCNLWEWWGIPSKKDGYGRK
jgi:hypothetical protein